MGVAAIGSEVGLYVDLVARVHVGDVIETGSGRRYGITAARVQTRGKRKGRQHLRATVLDPDDALPKGSRVHRIAWYRRKRKGIT